VKKKFRLQPRAEQKIVQLLLYFLTSVAVLVLFFILAVILKTAAQLSLDS